MTNSLVKHIDFLGSDLMALQDENKEIWVGVSYICNGLGLSKGQKDSQIYKIQEDTVLKKGCRKFPAGVFDENNNTIALKIDYVPIWLAKINITPKMEKETPELAARLEEYQLKAKDVLAEAFVGKTYTLPRDYLSALKALTAAEEEKQRLQLENKAMLPKAQYFDALCDRNTLLSVRDTVKELHIPERKFTAWLVENGYCFRNRHGALRPYAHTNNGYFEMKEFVHTKPDGSQYSGTQMLVTPRGREMFRLLCAHLVKDEKK